MKQKKTPTRTHLKLVLCADALRPVRPLFCVALVNSSFFRLFLGLFGTAPLSLGIIFWSSPTYTSDEACMFSSSCARRRKNVRSVRTMENNK